MLKEIKNQCDVSVQKLKSLNNELEVEVAGLDVDEELSQKRSEIERLQAKVSSLQNEKKIDGGKHGNHLERVKWQPSA